MATQLDKEAMQYAILTMRFEQEGKYWVGSCLELGTSTFARNLKQCEKELRELIGLHLNSLEDIGERVRVFRERGIKVYDHRPRAVEIPNEFPAASDTMGKDPMAGPYFQPLEVLIGHR